LVGVVEWIGSVPEQACSASTARVMAMRAFQRALLLRGDETWPVVGIALTASLTADRPKRGAHRFISRAIARRPCRPRWS